MYKELPQNISYPEIEKNILKFWEKHHIFEKSIDERDANKSFAFFEGPPTANGRPGIHHVISRTVKDAVCRLKTMQGFRVERKAGWDTHGLPVEIEVEKALGLDGKDQILEYGIEEFNKKCRESVWSYLEEWDELTRRMGYWIDLEHPYITYTNDYIETVWWILKEMWTKDLIYQGHKILPYCPHCETPLSSHEVSQGYEEVRDPSVYVKAKVKDEENTYFLVWTTTPWTLLSNVALALHPDVEYVKVRHNDELLILAKERLGVLEGDYDILQQYAGAELARKEYAPFFDFIKPDKPAYYTVLADFVTTTDGSGIVHMAPAFGEDDYQTGQKYNLPVLQPVDKSGKFTSEITPWAGQFVKDADKSIIKDLKTRNILYRSEMITHSYPHCWRCKSPLLYYARKSWYIKTTAYKDRLIENNRQIRWFPKEVGEGRFGEWLENNIDWSLSRDRFWGTPLPIWTCEKCSRRDCIGSIEELDHRSDKESTAKIVAQTMSMSGLDLHKPFIDKVFLTCENEINDGKKCGGKMVRVPEVIDCWFDSGSMPYAQWHYPFESKDKFQQSFPADFISEGVDQTRGWFYSLLAIGTILSEVGAIPSEYAFKTKEEKAEYLAKKMTGEIPFKGPAYKTCLSLELILDKEGKKMSKSIGNTVDPFALLAKQGADATRWYLLSTSPPWVPTRFDEEGVDEIVRKFLGTLVNTYGFFAMYANIDKFEYQLSERIPVKDRPELDRWICSSLTTLAKKINENLERFDLTKATRSISSFVIDDLSNWYVRRSRRRFWKSETGHDKLSAFQSLYECLLTVTKLMAPFAPFIAEEIYRNITRQAEGSTESVHLASYPAMGTAPTDFTDELLETRMDLVRRIVFLGRSLRNESAVKVRQPLPQIIILAQNERRKKLIEGMENLILDELNVKTIKYVNDEHELLHKHAEPIFKNLGPKFGKNVNQAAEAIRRFSEAEIEHLQKTGETLLSIDGHESRIQTEDINIISENKPGLVAGKDGDLVTALDTTITEELLYEGLAREFINRVQNMRKEADFEVTDRICITAQASPELMNAIKKMTKYIQNETLANSLEIGKIEGEFKKDWKINEEIASIGISRVQ